MLEELMKSNPPIFNRQIKKDEDVEAWLFGMKNNFRVHDYSENMKAIVSIFNLKIKANIRWEALRNVKDIREKEFSWRKFDKYLYQRYYDSKVKEYDEYKNTMSTLIYF